MDSRSDHQRWVRARFSDDAALAVRKAPRPNSLARFMSRWLAVLALAVSPAAAHDWYDHRSVPGTGGFLHCCGGRDCKRVSEQEFDIWMKDKNPLHHPIEDSEDDGWHICSQPAGDDRALHRALIVRCAFKPREISADWLRRSQAFHHHIVGTASSRRVEAAGAIRSISGD